MSTPTSDQRPAAAVLTHPAFDRPPVHNERRRGHKKGCPSLAMARRRRNAKRAQTALQTPAPLPTRDEPAIVKGQVALDAVERHVDQGLRGDALRVAIARDLGDAWDLESRAKSQPAPPPTRARPHEDAVIAAAVAILRERLRSPGQAFESVASAKEFLCLQLAEERREMFGVLFLDAQHALIEFEVLFQGTLSAAAVYPREVARRALELNAAAVILAHNHPSGSCDPSRADEALTQEIRAVLRQLDISTLDHIIVGGCSAVSFAERGLL